MCAEFQQPQYSLSVYNWDIDGDPTDRTFLRVALLRAHEERATRDVHARATAPRPRRTAPPPSRRAEPPRRPPPARNHASCPLLHTRGAHVEHSTLPARYLTYQSAPLSAERILCTGEPLPIYRKEGSASAW